MYHLDNKMLIFYRDGEEVGSLIFYWFCPLIENRSSVNGTSTPLSFVISFSFYIPYSSILLALFSRSCNKRSWNNPNPQFRIPTLISFNIKYKLP